MSLLRYRPDHRAVREFVRQSSHVRWNFVTRAKVWLGLPLDGSNLSFAVAAVSLLVVIVVAAVLGAAWIVFAVERWPATWDEIQNTRRLLSGLPDGAIHVIGGSLTLTVILACFATCYPISFASKSMLYPIDPGKADRKGLICRSLLAMLSGGSIWFAVVYFSGRSGGWGLLVSQGVGQVGFALAISYVLVAVFFTGEDVPNADGESVALTAIIAGISTWLYCLHSLNPSIWFNEDDVCSGLEWVFVVIPYSWPATFVSCLFSNQFLMAVPIGVFAVLFSIKTLKSVAKIWNADFDDLFKSVSSQKVEPKSITLADKSPVNENSVDVSELIASRIEAIDRQPKGWWERSAFERVSPAVWRYICGRSMLLSDELARIKTNFRIHVWESGQTRQIHWRILIRLFQASVGLAVLALVFGWGYICLGDVRGNDWMPETGLFLSGLILALMIVWGTLPLISNNLSLPLYPIGVREQISIAVKTSLRNFSLVLPLHILLKVILHFRFGMEWWRLLYLLSLEIGFSVIAFCFVIVLCFPNRRRTQDLATIVRCAGFASAIVFGGFMSFTPTDFWQVIATSPEFSHFAFIEPAVPVVAWVSRTTALVVAASWLMLKWRRVSQLPYDIARPRPPQRKRKTSCRHDPAVVR